MCASQGLHCGQLSDGVSLMYQGKGRSVYVLKSSVNLVIAGICPLVKMLVLLTNATRSTVGSQLLSCDAFGYESQAEGPCLNTV